MTTWRSTKRFSKVCQTAPPTWKCPKIQYWHPLTNWKLEPSPRSYLHPDLSSTHTEQVKRIYHGIQWSPEQSSNSLSPLKTRIWPTVVSKKFPGTPTKTCWSWAQFQPIPCKITYTPFPTHLQIRGFWPQIYSLWQALDWGLLPKILRS